ncbi:MAG: quinolinate synthase NadA [Candidatus Micrarchaeota archaeon]
MGRKEEIKKLKEDSNAIILAHNYQSPEVQDIADYSGDSLDLCRSAEKSDAEWIVFCGVDFMAETASILTRKKVLVPAPDAKCPMAGMLPAQQVREAKKNHPGVPVILYINTLAEAKAEADVICTSANLLQIIDSLDSDTVIFGPDSNMAHYARKNTNKKIITIPEDGHCIVHRGLIPAKRIQDMKKLHPKAILLAHPECEPEVQEMANYVASTNGMLKFAHSLPDKEFIIATEEGLGYRLSKENPGKTFYVITGAVCRNMKKTTLEKVRDCLQNKEPQVFVPPEIAEKARRAIERMMELSKR